MNLRVLLLAFARVVQGDRRGETAAAFHVPREAASVRLEQRRMLVKTAVLGLFGQFLCLGILVSADPRARGCAGEGGGLQARAPFACPQSAVCEAHASSRPHQLSAGSLVADCDSALEDDIRVSPRQEKRPSGLSVATMDRTATQTTRSESNERR